jgi:hypothetical protein
MRKAISILWPSFVVAGAAEVLLLTVIDPRELYLLGEPVTMSPLGTYSTGFLLFWAITAASSAFSCFLNRP